MHGGCLLRPLYPLLFELKREVLRFGKLTSKFPSDPIVRGTFFFAVKKAFKTLVKTKKRSFKEFLLQKIASFESDNPKDFWEMVNELRKKSANQISDKIDAEEWFTYFRKLSIPDNSAKSGFEKLVDFNVSKIAEFAKSSEPILDEPITLEEIRKASTKLKTGKAAVNDSTSNEMIKSNVSIIGPVLKILLNKVLNSDIFPQLWSVGNISVVFKAGDIGDPNNYRGITVCSCLGKFFTLIINDRLTKHLDEHNIIHNNQIGFRKGYRTSDHVFVLKSLIDLYTKNDKKVYACFVDFQKAYDTIWRNGLFYKLMKYGFSQKIIFLLKSMYDRVVSAVKVKSGRTATFTPLVGVRQGCNLSPTLFFSLLLLLLLLFCHPE